jgi:hypothetical protein
MSAPAYFRFARAVERLIKSDDGKAAILARRELEALIAEAPAASDCADPDLFAAFRDLVTRWSRRFDPVHRDRLSGPILSMAEALLRLPGEAERVRAEEAARRADPKLMAAEASS